VLKVNLLADPAGFFDSIKRYLNEITKDCAKVRPSRGFAGKINPNASKAQKRVTHTCRPFNFVVKLNHQYFCNL